MGLATPARTQRQHITLRFIRLIIVGEGGGEPATVAITININTLVRAPYLEAPDRWGPDGRYTDQSCPQFDSRDTPFIDNQGNFAFFHNLITPIFVVAQMRTMRVAPSFDDVLLEKL